MKKQTTKIFEWQKVQFMHAVLQHDLPLFLLVEIRDCLDMLNEFKLSNLFLNKELCDSALLSLQEEYFSMIEEKHELESEEDDGTLPYITPESSWLLTQNMLDRHIYPNYSHHEVVTIKAIFCVKCLFALKECINTKKEISEERGLLGRVGVRRNKKTTS
jgi:hypothetical protein